MQTKNWIIVASISAVLLIVAFLVFSRKEYSNFASMGPPPGYQVSISPPRSATNTWVTFNGSTLIVPAHVCGQLVRDLVLDTGSGKLVLMDVKPCVPTSPKPVELNYGSMGATTQASTGLVELSIGALTETAQMPVAYFAKSCDRGHCANILGLMPPESGGTFPHHSFAIIFDGDKGGWFALYPDPPDHATVLPYKIVRGFYTIDKVIIEDPQGRRVVRDAVVDSGTTLVEFPPDIDTSTPLRVLSPDGSMVLADLKTADMDTSGAVQEAFPNGTFVLGLPFFRRRHVAFDGDSKVLHVWY